MFLTKRNSKKANLSVPKELVTRFIFLNCFFQAFFGLEKMIRALGLPDNKLTKVPVDSLEILSLLTRQWLVSFSLYKDEFKLVMKVNVKSVPRV